MPNRNGQQYNGGIDNRTQMLTKLNTSSLLNTANRFQQMSHTMPETTYTYCGDGHFTNHMYQGNQNRRYTYHITSFRSSNKMRRTRLS